VAELFAGDGGLAEGDASVVGGDFAVGEDLETFSAQGFDAACEQQRILKAPAAKANAVEVEVGAHAAAHFNNGGDERVVEAGSDVRLRLAGFEASDHLVDHRAEVDVGGRRAGESEVIRVRCGIGVGIGSGFEHHGSLAFEGDGVAETDERGDGVEKASGGRGGDGVDAAGEHGVDDAEALGRGHGRPAGCIGDNAEGVEEIAAGDAPGFAHTGVAAGER